MKATTSRARGRHGKEQQGEIDDKPVADRSYCGHAGNASQHLMYMNRCVKDAVARRLLVDGAFKYWESWLLPDQKKRGALVGIDTMWGRTCFSGSLGPNHVSSYDRNVLYMD